MTAAAVVFVALILPTLVVACASFVRARRVITARPIATRRRVASSVRVIKQPKPFDWNTEGTPSMNHQLFNAIVEDVAKERRRQETMHPGMTPATGDFAPMTSLAILVEEVGEVARVLCDGLAIPVGECDLDAWYGELRQELIEVAAVAFAFIEGISYPEPDSPKPLWKGSKDDLPSPLS